MGLNGFTKNRSKKRDNYLDVAPSLKNDEEADIGELFWSRQVAKLSFKKGVNDFVRYDFAQPGPQGPVGPQGPSGGGLGGTNYVVVFADGTDIENAAELQAAYITAQGMSPSNTKRITIVAAPGYYNFESTGFWMNTAYIDLVSLDGNCSIIFNSSASGTISVTANNVFVKGVDTQYNPFILATNLNLLKVENCKGGDNSFRVSAGGGTVSGTFTNCVGGNNSFGQGGTTSGIFTNCIGGDSSFGGVGTISGTFTNCVGGFASFGAVGGAILSGKFTNCVGGDNSFAYAAGTLSGTFTNCIGGESSFGYASTVSGVFTNCTGGSGSFASGALASGKFTNCVAGDYSFGSYGTASGIFNNCLGGIYSFGGVGTLSGKLYYCRLTSGNFSSVQSGGVTRYCINGSNVVNNQG